MYILYIHCHGALRVKLPFWAKVLILDWLAWLMVMRDKVERVLYNKRITVNGRSTYIGLIPCNPVQHGA